MKLRTPNSPQHIRLLALPCRGITHDLAQQHLISQSPQVATGYLQLTQVGTRELPWPIIDIHSSNIP